MSLRDRQMSGFPLSKNWGIVFTLSGAGFVWFIAYLVWFPLFGVPEELQKGLGVVAVFLYLAQTVGYVKTGTERAQLCFGSYTGISFPAGVYMLPVLPFPVIILLLRFFLSEEVVKHLGWKLEGDVDINTVVIPLNAHGITSDGHRVSLNGKLFFEITSAAVALSQGFSDQNRASFESALQAEISSRIKRKFISGCTSMELHQGSSGDSSWLAEHVSKACYISEEFGVTLLRVPVVEVSFENERIAKSFDVKNAKDLFRANTNEVALAFKEFKETLPAGTSEEVAMQLFNMARIEDGVAPVDFNVLKLK